MKLHWKILIAIGLGILASSLWQLYGANHYTATVGDMADDYRKFNETYFYGGLPPAEIQVIDLSSWDDMGKTRVSGNGYYIIQIDPNYHPSKKQADMTLLHECCHVWNIKNGINEGSDHHGPAFQGCMLRLAKQGAFDGLW